MFLDIRPPFNKFSVKLSPFKIFLSFIFKSTRLQRNLNMGSIVVSYCVEHITLAQKIFIQRVPIGKVPVLN
jgi:hypothetical protein